MKILIVSQYFYPENFKINDIAEHLSSKNIVDVVTSIPNYPLGNFYEGYSFFSKRIDNYKGCRVFRCFTIPRKRNPIFRILNYFTFSVIGSFYAVILALFNNYDFIIVQQTSPIFQAIPGVFAKKITKAKLLMWVMDIWPDSMISGGNIKNQSIINSVNHLVKWIYLNCDRILITSKGFDKFIIKLLGDNKKVIYFPNWSDDIKKIQLKDIDFYPTGKTIMMAGTIANAQCVENIGKLILASKDVDINWVFVGDGTKKDWLENYVLHNNLNNKVFFLGKFAPDYMPILYEKADFLFISLKSNWEHLKAVIPGRLITYFAAGKPILGLLEGSAADLIKEANCGYTVKAEDYTNLIVYLNALIKNENNIVSCLSDNGRIFYLKHFTKEKCLKDLDFILNNYEA